MNRFVMNMMFLFFIIKGTNKINANFVSRIFKTEDGKRFLSMGNFMSEQVVASKLVCTTNCINEQHCCAASYDRTDGICRLTQNCRQEVESSSSSLVIKRVTDECQRSVIGYEYLGQINVTPGNRLCQRWNVNIPHDASAIYTSNMHTAINLDENFCRNADASPGGPWCYTTDPSTRWEYCNIPSCEGSSKECRDSSKGVEYFGHVTQSKSGHVCQRWDAQTIGQQEVYYLTAGQENYCRNPYGLRESPWCYVTDPIEWELCDIPFC